jgi:hypothetical protein
MMTSETKLLFALQQIENLTSLLHQNEYEKYFDIRLIQIRVELQRQLTNLQNSSKIKK